MSNFLNPADLIKLRLPELERMFLTYYKMAEDADWDLTADFERELRMLSNLLRERGSVYRL